MEKNEPKITKTAAEVEFEKKKEKRLMETILSKAEKSHKQRIMEFNEHLNSMSEHFDIPKVSWTKWDLFTYVLMYISSNSYKPVIFTYYVRREWTLHFSSFILRINNRFGTSRMVLWKQLIKNKLYTPICYCQFRH